MVSALLAARIRTFLHQRCSQGDAVGEVDGQHVNCHSADICFCGKNRTVPFEVVAPATGARIEKGNVPTLQIAGRQRPFMRVAALAAQGEVFGAGGAVQFLRNHVIDLKREQGDTGRKVTVLTALVGPLSGQLFEVPVHGESRRLPGLFQ